MFLRKSKLTSGVFKNSAISINYIITYKKMKHTYFRYKNNVLHISANKQYEEKTLNKIIDLNLDKILKLKNKVTDKKIHTEKYQLWGKVLSKEAFFESGIQNDSNMHKIYVEETKKMIESLSTKLSLDIAKIGLKLHPTKVKPLKSKYGSCHIIKREITINSFLAKLDPMYLYYVLLHEYAHLIIPNHQKPFYDCLDKMDEKHKHTQKLLRKHTIMF